MPTGSRAHAGGACRGQMGDGVGFDRVRAWDVGERGIKGYLLGKVLLQGAGQAVALRLEHRQHDLRRSLADKS